MDNNRRNLPSAFKLLELNLTYKTQICFTYLRIFSQNKKKDMPSCFAKVLNVKWKSILSSLLLGTCKKKKVLPKYIQLRSNNTSRSAKKAAVYGNSDGSRYRQ